MTSIHINTFLFTLSLILLATIGCSEVPDFGGGASVVPDVTYVAADAGTTDGDVDSTGTETPAATGEPGTFSGKVVMTGTIPMLDFKIKKGAAVKDPEVCAAVDLPDERLLVGEGNGVEGVFIYLSKAPKGGKPLTVPDTALDFDQEFCRFFPHTSVVAVGQQIRVLSDDTIAHNTHTNPKKNQSVSTVVEPKDREGKLKFVYKKTESVPLQITCDFHGWMSAWQLPVDHPYAVVTDKNGEFTIPDLPPGKHFFVVWHEAADGGFVERKFEVEIKSGEPTIKQIDYPAERLKL
jgi:hypothetical protein